MSHYRDYIKEYTDKHVLETDAGFATFSVYSDTIYLENIYIRPELRRSKQASILADQVCTIGKEMGCSVLMGSVVPSAKNSTISLKVLLGYGMALASASNDLIIFKKDI